MNTAKLRCLFNLLFSLFSIFSNNDKLICQVTMYYFSSDLFLYFMNYKNIKQNIGFIIHHIVTLLLFGNLHKIPPVYVKEIIKGTKIAEISNLGLYINDGLILYKYKNWNNIYYRIYFLIHVINYCYQRNYRLGLLILNNLYLMRTYLIVRFVVLTIYGGSLYWSYLLLRKITKYYK